MKKPTGKYFVEVTKPGYAIPPGPDYYVSKYWRDLCTEKVWEQ
jgi:hypothetical protein